MGKFHWVDFAARYQRGFRNHIVAIEELPRLVESFERYGCYATYFCFSDEVFSYLSAKNDDGVPSIAGYEGKVWAPFLPLDLDHPELFPALDAARRLCDLFLNGWGVAPDALQVYFSGAKGFHIMVDSRVFGRVAPAQRLPMVFDALRRHLAQALPEPLRQTVDLTIRDRVRLLRLPNTIHEKSGLHKVLIDAGELQRLSAADIRDQARCVRPLELTDESGMVSRADVVANPAAQELYRRVRRQLGRFTRKRFAYRFSRPADIDRIEFACAGLARIWHSHIEPGQRNNCAIRLASELRLLGLTHEEAEEKLKSWNARNEVDLPEYELSGVVQSAYQQGFPYRYSCRDPVRRRYCSLRNYRDCLDWMKRKAEGNKD